MLLCFIYFDGAEIKDTTTTIYRQTDRIFRFSLACFCLVGLLSFFQEQCFLVAFFAVAILGFVSDISRLVRVTTQMAEW